MKKIILLILLLSGQVCALQPGLASARKFATPMEQLQAKSRSTAQPIQTEEIDVPEYAPRAVLIFLHEPNNFCILESTSLNLTEALIQKAGPIIVSTSLLRSVLSYHLPPSMNEIDKNYNPCRRLLTQFDSNEWVIKEATEDLYLLIPHTYLKMVNIEVAELHQENANSLTAVELKLGLKVNHMRSLPIEKINTASLLPLENNYFVRALQEGKLFCERNNYQNSEVPQPLWTWYLSGHGIFKNIIAGILLEDFKKVLAFVSTKINMRLLMYQTCYGAGANTELIYHDEETTLQKTYPFIIATQAISDAPTTHTFFIPALGDKIARPDNFRAFVALVLEQDLDYERAIASLFHINPDLYYAGNIAQIKLPGTEWFSVMAGKNDVVTIGKIMARTRKEPLDIQKFFRTKDPKAILLESTYIPFELIINAPHMEYIISVAPGNMSTYLRGIRSEKHDINQILKWFQGISLTDDELFYKTIYIEHIVVQDKKGQSTEYTDIVIMPSGGVYFKHGSDIFFKELDKFAVNSAQVPNDMWARVYGPSFIKDIKERSLKYAQRSNARATEKTEGLSPENMSKLEDAIKQKAVAVGKLKNEGTI